MDRITVMRSFVAVAHAGSVGGAAQQLELEEAVVGRHLTELERQLEVTLLDRRLPEVSLTKQGRHYVEFSERVLAEMETEDAAIRSDHDRADGALAVIAPKWTGAGELAVGVAAFAREHPDIDVRFDVGGGADGSYGFITHGYDAEFHTKELRDSSVKVRLVATLPFALFASAEYLAEHGEPQAWSELAQHRCLIHENEPVWHLRKGQRLRRFKVPHACFRSNTYLALRTAILAGTGIGVVPSRPMLEELRGGRVKIVLPEYEIPARPLYIAYAPGSQSVKKLRLFVDFMVAWFADVPPLPLRGGVAGSAPPETEMLAATGLTRP